MADKNILNVKIRDTKSIVFEGSVDRISSYNEVGPFDVYPMHANFISILKNELALYKDNKIIKELKFELAVLKVKKDMAHIFLGIEGFLQEEEEMVNAHSSSTSGKNK